MIRKRLHIVLVPVLVSVLSVAAQPKRDQVASPEIHDKGRTLFRTHCAACHGVHREDRGPMLASITRKRSEQWLLEFIHNSQAVIAKGDKYANFIFDQYDRQVMPAFEQLSDQDIRAILAFIEQDSRFGQAGKYVAEPENDEQLGPIALRGKLIFRDQCQSCHFVDREGYGPALGSVTKRRTHEWLTRFIRNSTAVIASGDRYANHMFDRFDRRVMVSMPFLSDRDIDDLLVYIEAASGNDEIEASSSRLSQQRFTNTKTPPRHGEEVARYVLIGISVFAAGLFGYLLTRLFQYLQGR